MKYMYGRMLHWQKILTGEDRSVSQKHVPRIRTGIEPGHPPEDADDQKSETMATPNQWYPRFCIEKYHTYT